jgi:hypothetical protein
VVTISPLELFGNLLIKHVLSLIGDNNQN